VRSVAGAASLLLFGVALAACSTTQSRFSVLGATYPPKPESFQVAVFPDAPPSRPFARIARLDVHLEKTVFVESSLEDAMPELQKQARLAGADAIIEIREQRSSIAETRIYHVTATGIRYLDAEPEQPAR
jgi:Putative heavy-metal-binding